MANLKYGSLCLLLAIAGSTWTARWSQCSELNDITRSVRTQRKLIQQARELELDRKQKFMRQELSETTINRKNGNSNRYQPYNIFHFYTAHVNTASRKYGLSPALIKAVIHTESRFDKNAVSPKGAVGLMQLMPDTAREIGVYDLYDPHENIMGGTRLLREYIERFGSLKKALIAYNAGPTYVLENRRLPKETQDYLVKVIRYFRYYTAKQQGEAR